MADAALSSKSAATALGGTELLYCVQGGTTVYATPAQIKTYIIGAGSVSIASGKTFTASNTLTLAGTDGSTLNVGAGGTLGSAAYTASTAYEVAGAAAAAQAASQPVDSDLTAIAALTTTAYGRAFLALADAAAARATIGTSTTQTLTDAASITWDMATSPVAKVTLGGNRTLAAPTNLVDGGTYILRVIQDGTGSRTLAYDAVFKWPGGTAPVLSTAINAIDILTFVSDGTNLYGAAQKAFS